MRKVILTLALALTGMSSPVQAQEPADSIYTGGVILTIDESQPRAEAVAVRDGKIVAVGNLSDVTRLRGEETEVHDLAGRTLLPGFVDSHGHVVFGGLQALSANLLPPPDGPNANIAAVQDSLRGWISSNGDLVDRLNLIIGFGYDESQLAEQRPPSRHELDEVSSEIPVIIVHQSGHFGVANSKALEVAGVGKGS